MKTKAQLIEDFGNAMFNVIVRNPPAGFNVQYFSLLAMSGRIDEATEYLMKFLGESNE